MTKRQLIGVWVMATVVLGSASGADAKGLDDLWDILEPLSGPGPSKGGPVIAATIACFEGRTVRVKQAMQRPDWNDPCLYMDFRDLTAEPNAKFELVTAKLVEVGFSIEPADFLELGMGYGRAYFSTFVNKQEYAFSNQTFTPVRIIIKPLRVGKWRDDTRKGWLQVHVRGTVRFGDINGANFGVAPNTFQAGTEMLWGGGLVFDLLQAVRGR
jgi:hypothetical protein